MNNDPGNRDLPDLNADAPVPTAPELGPQTPAAGESPVDPQAEAAFWRAIYTRRLYNTGGPREDN